MSTESRAEKSVLNARINLLFYVLILIVTFFSRKIFLEKLGDDFVGMTSTLANLLGLLNLAELGVGSAVGYMLYKPLTEGNREQINRIISVLGFIYHKIGFVVIAGALILSIFLPWILENAPFPDPLIYFTFFSYLLGAVLGYFANYRQFLLNADQRQYVVTAYYQSANILRLLIQLSILYKTANPYYWVIIEITFSIIYCLILNNRINKAYPWLRSNVRKGRLLFKEYPELIRYTKQIFVHRVGGTVLSHLSPVFVYTYTSLTVVAYYTNYVLIVSKVEQLAVQLLGSADAGIGHLVAEGDSMRIQKVFAEIFALRYWIAGVLVGTLWFSLNPFIELWLGPEYLLPNPTVILILANLFIMLTRIADSFNMAYGLFYDTWAPITEAALNIGLSIVLGKLWGLNGVLAGTTISMLIIATIWKPYFLYHKGFRLSVWRYWKKVAVNLAILLVVFTIVLVADYQLHSINPANNALTWGLYTLTIAVILGVLLFGTMFLFTQGMKTLTWRMVYLVRCKLLHKNN